MKFSRLLFELKTVYNKYDYNFHSICNTNVHFDDKLSFKPLFQLNCNQFNPHCMPFQTNLQENIITVVKKV